MNLIKQEILLNSSQFFGDFSLVFVAHGFSWGIVRTFLRPNADLGEIERGDRDITFGVLCTICEGLTCDIAAMTKDIPFAVNSSSSSWDCWTKERNSGPNGS